MRTDLFTDRFESFLEEFGPYLRVGARLAMVFFIGYALGRHLPWEDAIAIVFAFVLVVRALIVRGVR